MHSTAVAYDRLVHKLISMSAAHIKLLTRTTRACAPFHARSPHDCVCARSASLHNVISLVMKDAQKGTRHANASSSHHMREDHARGMQAMSTHDRVQAEEEWEGGLAMLKHRVLKV